LLALSGYLKLGLNISQPRKQPIKAGELGSTLFLKKEEEKLWTVIV
jgi:hypothetical protein